MGETWHKLHDFEDIKYERTGDGIAENFSLEDAYREQVPDALADVIPPWLVLADPEEPIQSLRTE